MEAFLGMAAMGLGGAALAYGIFKGKEAGRARKQVDEKDRQLQGAMQDRMTDRQQLATLRAQLAASEQQMQARLNDLAEQKVQLTQNFENLAQRIFEEKSQRFTLTNKENIAEVLNPLARDIHNFKQRVEQTFYEETKDRVALKEELRHLRGMHQQLSTDAQSLTNALRGNQKLQGHWGEVILERILETSGLTRDREYRAQSSIKGDGGQRYQPDVVIHLPENKEVVIDAKVSLVAYERYCNADVSDPASAEKALKDHITSVRTHINGLSAKAYEALPGINSPEFVLMFMPVEAAFHAAIRLDEQLFLQAFEKNVILVSPTTLLITLRTIHSIWRHEYQNQNAQEIAKRAGDLYDKLAGFTEALTDVGDKLQKAQKAHELAIDRLWRGPGSVVRRAEGLKTLGIKTRKSIAVLTTDPCDIL